MNGVDNYFMGKDLFTITLDKPLEYFNHIRKQGNWQRLDFFCS